MRPTCVSQLESSVDLRRYTTLFRRVSELWPLVENSRHGQHRVAAQAHVSSSLKVDMHDLASSEQ